MFRVEVHRHISQICSVLYRVGVWHREDEPTVGEMRLKFFYSFYHYLFVISVIAGALGTDDVDESIFLVEHSLLGCVVLVKLLYIIWRKEEILKLLNRLCVYSVHDEETFTQVKRKLDFLMKFVFVFLSLTYITVLCTVLVIPFVGSERKLFVNIGFPLDVENNEFAFWMAFTFIFTQIFTVSIAVLFPPIFWYLMTNCGLRFEVLGQQIKAIGQVKSSERIGIANGRGISDSERDNLYLRDLLECIASHTQLKGLTSKLDSFLSELFVVQLTTSALCICCSIYCLAFKRHAVSFEYVVYIMLLLYNTFDIFMVTYLGNEIKLTSDKLSYCLFESEWIHRPQSTKKIILIFGEFLLKPEQLVVLKLYPLNLETFTMILRSAYSTFNILQNFK